MNMYENRYINPYIYSPPLVYINNWFILYKLMIFNLLKIRNDNKKIIGE